MLCRPPRLAGDQHCDTTHPATGEWRGRKEGEDGGGATKSDKPLEKFFGGVRGGSKLDAKNGCHCTFGVQGGY